MSTKNRALIEQDLILIYVQDQPAFYARVEKIIADVKKGWWRVTMLVLQVPLKMATWIIDEEQIRGADFTMGGIPIRIERVIPPELPEETASEEETTVEKPVATVRHLKKETPPDAAPEKPRSGARIFTLEKPKSKE